MGRGRLGIWSGLMLSFGFLFWIQLPVKSKAGHTTARLGGAKDGSILSLRRIYLIILFLFPECVDSY